MTYILPFPQNKGDQKSYVARSVVCLIALYQPRYRGQGSSTSFSRSEALSACFGYGSLESHEVSVTCRDFHRPHRRLL